MYTRPLTNLVSLLLFTIPTYGAPPFHPNLPSRASSGSLSNMEMPNSTLPPPTGLVLQFLALGIGTQNYTCNGSTSASTPASGGAVATLYDMQPLNDIPSERERAEKVISIPPLALSLASNQRDLDLYLKRNNFQSQLGKHFFTAAMIPTFLMANVPPPPFPQANCKKVANMTAPVTSCPGRTKEGAVDWLYLTDAGGSIGVNTVYRLVTAGGKPPATCQEQKPTIEVPYVAEYWVYGPAA